MEPSSEMETDEIETIHGLESIVSGLSTDQARVIFLSKLFLHEGGNCNAVYEFNYSRWNLFNKTLKRIGDPQRANQVIAVAQKYGLTQRITQCLESIEFGEENKYFQPNCVIYFARKSGLAEEALRLSTKAVPRLKRNKNYITAALYAWDAGLIEQAQEIALEMTGHINFQKNFECRMEGIYLLYETGLVDQSRQLYDSLLEDFLKDPKKSRDSHHILTYIDLVTLGMHLRSDNPKIEEIARKEIEFYNSFKPDDHHIPYKFILELAKCAGLTDLVSELLSQGIEYHKKKGEYYSILSLAQQAGSTDLASEMVLEGMEFYRTSHDYINAFSLGMGNGFIEQAREIIIQGIDHFKRKNNIDRAIHLAEYAGLSDQAQKMALRVVESSERKGDFKRASIYAQSAGLPEKLKLYQEICRLISLENF
jgi:hypothetical protein